MHAHTIPTDAQISLIGFEESLATTRFIIAMRDLLLEISGVMDLSLLDGVTVAWDLAEGLQAIDREPDSPQISFTNTEHLKCVAKVVPVTKDGDPRIHVVYTAPFVVGIATPEDKHFQQAQGIVVHELGHVAEHKWYLDAFPERRLDQGYSDSVAALLLGTAEVMWSEYAACRLSAPYASPDELVTRYANSLSTTAEVAPVATAAAVSDFRLHRDVDLLLIEAGGAVCEPLRHIGYLLGHLHGLGRNLRALEACPELPSGYTKLWDRSATELQRLWDNRGAWSEHGAAFHPLRSIAEWAMGEFGIQFHPLADGRTYVSVGAAHRRPI